MEHGGTSPLTVLTTVPETTTEVKSHWFADQHGHTVGPCSTSMMISGSGRPSNLLCLQEPIFSGLRHPAHISSCGRHWLDVLLGDGIHGRADGLVFGVEGVPPEGRRASLQVGRTDLLLKAFTQAFVFRGCNSKSPMNQFGTQGLRVYVYPGEVKLVNKFNSLGFPQKPSPW